MDPLTAAAASGLQARMDSLDLLANNLANTSTSGYKADREFYTTYFSPEVSGLDPTVGDSPVVEKRWTDFAQGPLLSTGNPTDLALSGSGFFAVNGPNGPLYTRNGSFQISSQGRLVSAEGYPVRLSSGQPLDVQPGAPIQISADGQVAQNGVPLGQDAAGGSGKRGSLAGKSGIVECAAGRIGGPSGHAAAALGNARTRRKNRRRDEPPGGRRSGSRRFVKRKKSEMENTKQ